MAFRAAKVKPDGSEEWMHLQAIVLNVNVHQLAYIRDTGSMFMDGNTQTGAMASKRE